MLGVVAAIGGFAALAAVWLHPGVPLRTKLMRSIACVAAVAAVLVLATQVRSSSTSPRIGATRFRPPISGRWPSFASRCSSPFTWRRKTRATSICVATSWPSSSGSFRDVTIRLATTGQSVVGSTSEEAYGEIEYSYAGRTAKSRSTSHREILPLLYALAGRPVPPPGAGEDYPGYPLVADARPALLWFFGGLPLLIVLALVVGPPRARIPAQLIKDGGQP